MKKLLRTFMLAVLFLPFALQAQTECSSLSIPYAENFDAYTGNATGTTAPTGYPAITLPDCWTFLNMSATTSTYPQAFLTSSSTYAVSGNCLFFKSSSTTPLYAIMPSVGDQTGAWQLSFQYRNEGTTASNGTIIVGTMTDVTDASTFVTLQILERTTTKTLMEIIIPAGTVTNGARLAFCYEGGTSNNYYAAIDNVTLDVAPTCVKVTSLAIDETLTSPNSLTMTWTDALNIGATYSVYDMSDTTFITGGINDYTYTVTGLAANTAYTFGIQTDCGGGDIADGYVTVSGRTACAAQALPWTCGFEADEIVSTSSLTALPWCSERYTSAYTSTTHYPYSYSSTTYAHDGSRVLYFYGGTGTTYPDTMALILPEIDVNTYPMNANRMTFWARSSSTSYDKTLYVYTLSNATDINSATLIDSVVVTGTTHVKYSVSLANAPATDAYVVLMATKANGYLILDDLTLEVAPSCPDITGLAVTAITSNSMTLSWNSTEGAMGYTIYDADGELFATTTETTYTIENLDANTNYTFGLQSNCSAGDGSVSTVSGRTSCAAEALPFIETFDVTLSSDPCWRGATGVTAAEVFNGAALTLSGISAGYWNYSTSQNGFTDGHYYNNIYGSSRKAWMITPAIDLSTASSAQLSFDLALTAYSGTMQAPAAYTGGQKFMVIVSTDGGNTWLESNATVWMRADSNANYAFEDIPYDHYGNYIINLNQYLGNTIKIAFYGESTVSGGDNNFHIDNIAVTEVPSCPPVMGLTLDGQTATTASIHWNDNGSVGYDVEVSQNDVPLTDVTVVVTDTTAEISGLAVDNDYQIAVRSICGSDYGQWTAPLNIHIGYCTPNPTSVDNNGITSVSFGGMTNTTHPTVAGYADYTSMSGTVPAGLPATVEITYETGYTYGTIIWVDWNNSMSFEGNEVVYAGTSASTNPTTLAATFDVPATMQQGSYRMRIVGADMAFDSYTSSIAAAANANPCATYSYGVAEDYTLIVGDAPACLPVTNLVASNITAHEATLTWESDASSFNIYDMSDSSFVANVTTNTYDLTGLTSETTYTFGVATACGSEESILTTVSFTTLISCPAPTALNVTYNPNDPSEVTLSWTENGTATDWQIALSGDETNLIDVTTNPYTLTNLIPDSIYTAKVRAYCDVDDHSTWSNTVSFEYSTKTVIGSGDATNSYLPTYCLYNYSLTQQIYTVAELGDAGLIESIDFYNDGTAERIRNLSVYIVSTPKDTFESATDWISVSAADLQFSGNVTFAPQAWTTIPLDGFAYDGLNNIAIIVDDNTGSWQSSMSFRVFDAPSQALRIYSDGTNYDVNAPSYSGTVMNVKNQIRLVKGDLSGCLKPSGVTVSYTGGDQAVVTWSSDATSFNIDVNGVVTNNVTSPYTLSGLSLATIYTVSLQAVCSPTSVSEWTNPINFTTDACMPVNQCTVSIYAQDSYGDGWNGNTIHIIQNGVTVASYSMATQNLSSTPIYDTFQVNVCSGVPVDFAWESGSFAYETSFQILNGSDSVVYSVADGSTLSDTVFLTLSDACAGSTPTESLTIHLTINNPALGTINPVPGTYVVALNDSLVLSATPAAGATFDGWKISFGTQTMGTIPFNPFTLPVNQNNIAFGELNVVAMFSDSTSAPDSMTVIINTADATMGTTNPAPGTYNFAVGSQTFVTAIPNDGYQLLYWIESMTVGDITVTDTLIADTIIVNVIPIMAGITSSLTACFEAIPVQPCAVPTGLTATAIHNESIELAWDNANVNGWNVQWRVGTGTWASAHTTTNSYTITGLTGLTTYEIQVQADCGDGNLSDWSNSITATTTNVGIENFTDLKVTLFPNPAREYVDIRIDGNANVTAMEVFDVYGKLINTVNVIDNLTRINVNGLADGMYFVRVTTDNGTVTKTFVKK